MLELMFTAHNRREYVAATLEALRDNTNWALVERLHIVDDHSTDGTLELLTAAVRDFPCAARLTSSRFGGPVAAMNHVLDHTKADVLGKIDSDVVCCPGWLDAMTAVLQANPNIDALGMEPSFGAPVEPVDVARFAKPAPFIGGVFLAHTRVFKRRPQMNDRWFGLTSHWRRYAKTAWIDPDLPCFLLDHIGIEPWQSLSRRYIEMGWARHWESYYTAPVSYYDWWLPTHLKGKMETAAN